MHHHQSYTPLDRKAPIEAQNCLSSLGVSLAMCNYIIRLAQDDEERAEAAERDHILDIFARSTLLSLVVRLMPEAV